MKLVMWKKMIWLKLDIEFGANGYTQEHLDKTVKEIVEKFGFEHGYIEYEE